MRQRHEHARRITGELVDLYKRRARRLHAEACRNLWRPVWSSLWQKKLIENERRNVRDAHGRALAPCGRGQRRK